MLILLVGKDFIVAVTRPPADPCLKHVCRHVVVHFESSIPTLNSLRGLLDVFIVLKHSLRFARDRLLRVCRVVDGSDDAIHTDQVHLDGRQLDLAEVLLQLYVEVEGAVLP